MNENNKKVIEVVDDHVQTATFISEILEFNNYKTYEAYNAEDAIAIAKEKNPDLIILDLILEKIKGDIVLEKLPKQKIILMDLYDLKTKEYSKYKNIIGFIKKPIDSEKLLKSINEALKK